MTFPLIFKRLYQKWPTRSLKKALNALQCLFQYTKCQVSDLYAQPNPNIESIAFQLIFPVILVVQIRICIV